MSIRKKEGRVRKEVDTNPGLLRGLSREFLKIPCCQSIDEGECGLRKHN